jgi:two-component system, cell cycle response regulator DivK
MRTIALVEDNPDNRLLVRAILDDYYEIREYEDGVSALAGLGTDGAELVLLDISLPGLDGLEVLRRMRERPELAQIPVIALTAHAMSGDREKFMSAGFDGYLTKPIVDESLLIAAIGQLLE